MEQVGESDSFGRDYFGVAVIAHRQTQQSLAAGQGEFFGIGNRCPHNGASLCKGRVVGLVEACEPGSYQFSRRGELVRCPWHGWEFDLRTGKSRCEPDRTRVRSYDLKVEPGSALTEGPLKAETFAVSVEKQYVVVEV